jgi:hypothetical protein
MFLGMNINGLLQNALLPVKPIQLLVQLFSLHVVGFRILNTDSVVISDSVQFAKTVSELTELLELGVPELFGFDIFFFDFL